MSVYPSGNLDWLGGGMSSYNYSTRNLDIYDNRAIQSLFIIYQGAHDALDWQIVVVKRLIYFKK